MRRTVVCALGVMLVAIAPALDAADPPAPASASPAVREAERRAVVATGASVKLAPSARSAAEWTSQRPRATALRPKARGTFD